MFQIIIVVAIIAVCLVLLLVMCKYISNKEPDQFEKNKEIHSKVYTKRLLIEF